MRIAFLSSSSEPGRDGVGDYARSLAGELIKRGNEARVIALADPFTRGIANELQETEGVSVATLRLAQSLPWHERVTRARAWLEAFVPDWVSLQFVCFGFHPKGIIHGAVSPLQTLCAPYRTHLMFHELWVGPNAAQSWRVRAGTKAWGMVQRHFILRLYRRLKPRITHTNIEFHERILRQHGIAATVLPLFSNIPQRKPTGWLGLELDRLGISQPERKSSVLLGIFGSVQAEWTNDGWLEQLIYRARKQGRRVAILGIGRLNAAGNARFQALAAGHRNSLVVHHFGEQPVERVSEFFQTVDGGISTMQRSLLGKSSTFAAMLDHNVPVLVTRTDDAIDRERARARVLQDIDEFLGNLGKPRPPRNSSLLEDTASSLVTQLCAQQGSS
jgi:hypothetical protein